jgi:hypothetical protein
MKTEPNENKVFDINAKHNQSDFFPRNVHVCIEVTKNDDQSHTIRFQIQTKDRRNSISKSFTYPREKGEVSCEIIDNEVVFFQNGDRKFITEEIE